jgi:hypothetical protein
LYAGLNSEFGVSFENRYFLHDQLNLLLLAQLFLAANFFICAYIKSYCFKVLYFPAFSEPDDRRCLVAPSHHGVSWNSSNGELDICVEGMYCCATLCQQVL